MLRHLALDAIVDLPPELNGGLTFHLPLEVFALLFVGADHEHIDRRITAELSEAYRNGLVDPPMYRWALEQYESVARGLLSSSDEQRNLAIQSIQPLGDGLAGAAFHGLIRLGYGAMRHDVAEIARGLAYLRIRRLVLESPGVAPAGLVSLPGPNDMSGTTIFDRLTVVAGSGRVSLDRLPSAKALAAVAVDLVRHDANSFVAIHCVTGLHALAEVHNLVIGAAPCEDLESTPLARWWRGYAVALDCCALLVAKLPVIDRSACAPAFTTRDQLVSAAVESCDTHSIKLTVALQRLVELGLVDEPTFFELVELKLAVDECSA